MNYGNVSVHLFYVSIDDNTLIKDIAEADKDSWLVSRVPPV